MLAVGAAAFAQLNEKNDRKEKAGEDWVLVCDNTNTCRLAGYQMESDDHPVSVLITREAGDVPMSVYLALEAKDQPLPAQVKLTIDGEDLGEVPLNKEGRGLFNAVQAQALGKSIGKNTVPTINFTAGERVWRLSPNGARRRFIELEEKQKRINRPGSFTSPGDSTTPVLAAKKKPVLKLVVPPDDGSDSWSKGDAGFAEFNMELNKRLKNMSGGIKCHPLINNEEAVNEFTKFTVFKLTNDRVLLQSPCEYGTYNMTSIFAVVSGGEKRKIDKVYLISSFGESDDKAYGKGVIRGVEKPGGREDCTAVRELSWDGYKFEETKVLEKGLCRGFSKNPWELPSVVSDVQ